MGKKKRLNRLISRWIKSDLPQEDGSPTVLLLGVTRIPTSPPPRPRRPRSLALAPPNPPPPSVGVHVHPQRHRPISIVHPYSYSYSNSRAVEVRVATPVPKRPERELTKLKYFSPDGADAIDGSRDFDDTPTNASSGVDGDDEASPIETGEWSSTAAAEGANHDTSSASASASASAITNMERSVDSIGTCSLDVDASAELLSDWCENPSVDTLRSASIKSLTPQQEQHRLPSYLSLACTVNGYSQITNYDPVRLAKSRDSSPHRPLTDAAADQQLTYAIQNNLLSPPNLVPLPLPLTDRFRYAQSQEKMTEHTRTIAHHHEEFYSAKKMFISSETTTRSKYSYISDACFNGHQIVREEVKEINGYNGHGHGRSNGHGGHVNGSTEPKSFIQQRVERLYGPGALAQGFFVMKRQKSRLSESDVQPEHLHVPADNEQHSKSMSDKLLLDADDCDASMKQSASSPSLPVLRHLTPEFRAQLPTFSPRRGVDTIMQKSTTLPQLKDIEKSEVMVVVNGTFERDEDVTKLEGQLERQNLHENNHCNMPRDVTQEQPVDSSEDNDDVKDGHYFLRILEKEALRLLQMADKVEEELDAEEGRLNEDAKGFLRSAAGKARLLVSQKMQQFRGLCTNNLNQAEGEAFPTTNQDLQGFWDMVMLQVVQIDKLYKELEVLRANNWQEVIRPIDTVDRAKSRTKLNSTSTTRVRSAGAEEARVKREAQRKAMLEQRRKAMRETKSRCATNTNESIEIFVPESS